MAVPAPSGGGFLLDPEIEKPARLRVALQGFVRHAINVPGRLDVLRSVMAKWNENRRSSFLSKAWWTDEDPWPYIKRTLLVFFVVVILLGFSRLVV